VRAYRREYACEEIPAGNGSSFLCAAVNIRFMMVRPNKTKPESYMRPPTVPGGGRQYTHARKAQTSRVRIPAGPPFLFFYGVLTQISGGMGWFYVWFGVIIGFKEAANQD
jgi:hypothetical protein